MTAKKKTVKKTDAQKTSANTCNISGVGLENQQCEPHNAGKSRLHPGETPYDPPVKAAGSIEEETLSASAPYNKTYGGQRGAK